MGIFGEKWGIEMKKVFYLLAIGILAWWTLTGCGVDPLSPGEEDDKGGVDLSDLEIHDGIGVGEIELGRSSLADIREVYGEPDFENGRGVNFFNKYGLRFMTKVPEGMFYAVEFTSPYRGMTLLGVANGDLRTKVITSYGAPDDFTADSSLLEFLTNELGLGGLKGENLLFYDRVGILFVITDNEIVSSIFIFNRFLLRPSPSPSPTPSPTPGGFPTPIPSPSPSPEPTLSPSPTAEETPTPSPPPVSALSLLGIDDGVGVGEISVDGTTFSSKVEEIFGPPEALKGESDLKELAYNSIGIFFFTDEADIVRSITLASPYQGETNLGIKLGNHYKLVWAFYGYPDAISEGNDHYYCRGVSFAYDPGYNVNIILVYEPSCALEEN